MSVALSPSSFFAPQRVSVMYVCFSLARSLSSSKDGRPAMSIALSPSGFFASQRVSVSAPNRRELVVPFACQLARKINQKTQRKSTEDRSPETPRGNQNRLKIAAWTLSGDPVACKSLLKASPERLGSVPERPRRPPGAVSYTHLTLPTIFRV